MNGVTQVHDESKYFRIHTEKSSFCFQVELILKNVRMSWQSVKQDPMNHLQMRKQVKLCRLFGLQISTILLCHILVHAAAIVFIFRKYREKVRRWIYINVLSWWIGVNYILVYHIIEIHLISFYEVGNYKNLPNII